MVCEGNDYDMGYIEMDKMSMGERGGKYGNVNSKSFSFSLNYVVAYLNKVNVQRNKFNLILIDVWH